MNKRLLRYRAGPRALQLLRREGLAPGMVRALIGPASGPKWLVLPGIDRALMSSGLLATAAPIQLAGASAGAWRMLCFASKDPVAASRGLLDGYIEQTFTRRDRPATVSAAYRRLLSDLFRDQIDAILRHPVYDMALHTARLRHGRSRWTLAASLAAAALSNQITPRATGWFFERVLFHSRAAHFKPEFEGRITALTRANLLPAALASGTVPIYLETVSDPPGAPPGAYVDGGVTDYHLRQRFVTDDSGGVVLFPHYQPAVFGRWLDKKKPSRALSVEVTNDLVQLYPSAEFIAGLPGGCLPDREDFKRFVDAPEKRIDRWRSVAAASEVLGQELLDDIESGGVAALVEPM